MNIKNKGFTLTEILGVIIVISLLLILIMPTIVNRISGYKSDAATSEEKLIFQATDLYMEENKDDYPNTPGNIYCITIKQLLATGNLVDPIKKAAEDGNYTDDTTVEVTISGNGVRTYKINEDKNCKVNVTNDIVIMVDKEKVWAKAKTVTIYYPKLDGNYNNEYRINNGDWQTWNGPLTLKQNGTVEARAAGKTIVNKSKKVDKIDTVLPIVNVSKGSWDSNGQQAFDFVLQDMDSGIDGYYLSLTNSQPAINSSAWTKYPLAAYGGSGSVSFAKPVGTYYMFVKDKAGNVQSLSVVITDTTPPVCGLTPSGTAGANDWYRSNVTVSLSSKSDAHSGLAGFGMGTSVTPSYNSTTSLIQSEDTKGMTYYGYVKDNAGNVNTCSVSVKKDVTNPSLSGITNSGGGVWTNQSVNIGAKASDSTSGMSKISYSYSSNGSSPANDWNAGSSATSVVGTWSANRNSTVYIVGTDNAGNSAIQSAGAVKIDKTPPNAPYMSNSWFEGDLSVNSNSCKNIGGGQANVACDVYISTGRYSTWSFDTSYTQSDAGGSGVSYGQDYWTHNGSSGDYYPNWSTNCCGGWLADSGGYNYATWINWGTRSVDVAGNGGYSLTMRIHISYW